MSNKVEAATGGTPATFTDDDGEVYEAVLHEESEDYPLPMVEVITDQGQVLSFYKADATKIIALIAEAAK